MRKAVFEMALYKALGLSEDLTNVALDCLNNEKLPEELNKTFISSL